MKLKSITNILNRISKKAYAILLVPVLITTIFGIAFAQSDLMEGNTTSLNVTAGETQYKKNTNAKDGEVVQVQVWLHNRENPAGEQAKNTKVKVTVPQDSPATTQKITGTITSDNFNTVTDSTNVLLPDEQHSINYIPGSAKYRYNKGAADGRTECETGFNNPPLDCYATVAISDAVISGGVNLDTIRGGTLRGCNAHHETVIVQVRVKKPATDRKFTKQVRKAGDSQYSKFVSVKPGDKQQWLLSWQNTGGAKIDDAAVWDQLPPHLQVVAGSVRWIYVGTNGQNQDVVQSDTDLFNKYVNFGSWAANGGFFLRFDTIAKDDFTACKVTIRNLAHNKIKQSTEKTIDYSDVEIKKQNCVVEEPKVSCDLLKLEIIADRKVRVTVNTTATPADRAKIKLYNYDFGDGNKLTTDKNVVEHQYGAGDKFTISSEVTFEVDGKLVTDEGDCVAEINFSSQPPQTPPTELPNTGTGEIVGVLFSVVVGSYIFMARRFARN